MRYRRVNGKVVIETLKFNFATAQFQRSERNSRNLVKTKAEIDLVHSSPWLCGSSKWEYRIFSDNVKGLWSLALTISKFFNNFSYGMGDEESNLLMATLAVLVVCKRHDEVTFVAFDLKTNVWNGNNRYVKQARPKAGTYLNQGNHLINKFP